MTLIGLTLTTASTSHLKLFKLKVAISKVNHPVKEHSDKP